MAEDYKNLDSKIFLTPNGGGNSEVPYWISALGVDSRYETGTRDLIEDSRGSIGGAKSEYINGHNSVRERSILEREGGSQDQFKRFTEVTNESMYAVLGGLEPDENDRVLSICGTGDIPLALLESGCHVDAVDLDPDKVRLAREHLKLLQDRNHGAFLSVVLPAMEGESARRNDYFRLPDRFDAIADNTSNIDIRQEGILEALSGGGYTKVWLSNIIGYKDQDYNFAVKLFTSLSHSLEIGGLFYSTNGLITQKYLERAYEEDLIPKGMFVLDEERTKKAQAGENHAKKLQEQYGGRVYGWKPCVYRRVA